VKSWHVAVALLLATIGIADVGLKSQTATAAVDGRPNIIIIISDDQRADMLNPMKTVRQELRAKGADFEGVIPTSTCCPSRTSLLTGLNSHTTGVWTNRPRTGGWPTFFNNGFEKQTIATALHDRGYTTGMFGKYLNFWNRSPAGYIPPGWDVFDALWEDEGAGAGAYYNYEIHGTSPIEAYGNAPEDYSTRVIGSKAVDFISTAEGTGNPYLAYIATTGPHRPMTPDPRDVGAWTPKALYDNPAVNEQDVSDKPHYIKRLNKVSTQKIWRFQHKTGETLLSVDRLVRQVLNVADLSNTLVIYMSDNGLMWGDHRLTTKNLPYRWSTDVPLIMRWDGHIQPGEYGMATNTDVGATVLDAAQASGALTTEGTSVLDGTTRHRTVLESNKQHYRPGYCGVRTDRYLFVQYQTGTRELYDYQVDPYELDNMAGSGKYAKTEDHLQKVAKNLCDPTPPGFSWTQ
jgi:arylsulfatase A-like enzyme